MTTPALKAGSYTYRLSCSNSAGKATKNLGVRVVSTSAQLTSDDDSGGTALNASVQSMSSSTCRWWSQSNQIKIRSHVGVVGGLKVNISWCTHNGYIKRVARSTSVIGPSYPLSLWTYNGITSYGPCDENCGNYASLYSTSRKQINIWEQGHWSLCVGVPIFGSVCIQEAYRKVGVLIRGDGTRERTWSS